MDVWLKHFAMKAGEIIRNAREKRGWSQARLGQLIPVSQVAIRKIEIGETVKSKHLAKIAQVLDLDLRLLDPALSPDRIPTVRKLSGIVQPQVLRLEQDQILGKDDLPVLRLAPGEQGALVLFDHAFRAISRPHNLLGVDGGFGLQIAGNTMAREYSEGDIAYVDPNLIPRTGDPCMFQNDERGTAKVKIKYLESATDELWHVSQANPPKKFTLRKSEWHIRGVLVGKQSSRG